MQGFAVLEVLGSNPSHDTISIVGVYQPAKQLVKFSPPNMSYIVNSKFVSHHGKTVN